MVTLVVALLMGADTARINLAKEFTKQELPFERINGISVLGSKWVVGSMRGLYLGSPGTKWEKVSDQSIRQVASTKAGTWVLYGNGAVDKLDVASNRLYYDVLHGAVKRPWVGSLSVNGASLCFGGSGGWFEKLGEKSLTETYPDELKGKEVTVVASDGTIKLLGTQDGLFAVGTSKTKRFGFGDGLADVWITAMAKQGNSVVIGTYSGGLYSLTDGNLKKMDAPSTKVRSLLVWRNWIVLGGLDGAWIQTGHSWNKLTISETTFLNGTAESLMIGTPSSVSVFQ